MLFDTSIAGSLPKPGWLAETRKLWPRWIVTWHCASCGRSAKVRSWHGSGSGVEPPTRSG